MRKVGAHRYQKTQSTTASKERIMVMLFQTALKHIRSAKSLYDEGQIMNADILVRKALDIIWELQDTLNPTVAPELVTNLSDIYTFVNLRLLNTLTSKTKAPLDDADRAFAPLVDAFEKAVEQVKNPPLAANAG
ncbi:MAG: flagellar protein FliS [Deltaproteobacteria bacterium]|nr:flagellar protein FliS [Deltaproteobacteria bacterium]